MRDVAELRAGRNDWFRIENKTTEASTVYIYDEIGYWGVTAQDFVDELNKVTSSEIVVHINSPGGNVFDGIAILNSLRNHRHAKHITTIVDGVALSAASFIAQAGHKRVMARNSQMMIHDASGLCVGNSTDMREMVELLDKASDNIADIYAARSGKGDVASWRALMSAETWYSDDEAVEAGLADEVDGKEAAAPTATFDLSIFAHAGREHAPAPTALPARPGLVQIDRATPEEMAEFAALWEQSKGGPIAHLVNSGTVCSCGLPHTVTAPTNSTVAPFDIELFKKGFGHGA